MTPVSINLCNTCLIDKIIVAIIDAIYNARDEGSCPMNYERAYLSFMQNVSKFY